MTTTKNNPKIDWGYYASVPRIVRVQYKQLSHADKWLYVCLKDLCGDKGTCYRTLRTLAQETDLSIGSLSTSIRNLHEAGLIHAEKKRRSNNPTGKEVWHISIVDIWQANANYCSADEQQCSGIEHSTENVQELNKNVQNLNDNRPLCSGIEQKCSKFDDRRKNNKDNSNEERTDEESIGAIAPPLSESSLYVSLDELSQQTYEKAVEFLTPHGAIEEVKASHTPAETIILAQKLYDEGFRQDGYHVEVTCAFCGEMAHAFCCQCEQLFCKQHLAIIPTEPEDRNTFCPSCFEKRNQTAPLAQKVPEPEPPQQQQHAAPTQRRSAKKEPPQAAWTARAMVAKAEALRERPYTDKQRPKELKAAQKLLEQKPDITPEEFERVFQQRNDAWWREHNGPLNVTDLAATPKDKNDLRYMLVLAQIQREAERKKPPSDQKVVAPPAPVRPLVADSSSVAQIQAMRARKMAERAQSQGGR